MPIYPYFCKRCKRENDYYLPMEHSEPVCECGEVMTRRFSIETLKINMGYPSFVDRIDEIHKRQADRGEKLTLPHPSEVRAS